MTERRDPTAEEPIVPAAPEAAPAPTPVTAPAAILTESDEDVALGQTIAKIKAFKWPVLGLAAFFAAAGSAYTYFKAPTWEARATLILVVPEMRGASLQMAFGLNQPSPLALLQGVVKSRSELDYVSKQTGIARRDLEKWLIADTDTPSNQLQLSASHRDQQMALKMVSSTIEGLTLLNREIGFSTAAQQVKYLEGTIRTREKELTAKQNAVVRYQRGMTVPVDPKNPESAGEPLRLLREAEFELGSVRKSIQVARQSAAATASTLPEVPSTVPSINALRTKLNALELELRNLQIQLGDEAADVIYTRRQIENTRVALRQETARYLRSVQSNVDPRLAELEARRIVLEDQVARLRPIVAAAPREAVEFARLVSEAEGAAQVLQTLREGYERARTEAEVDKVRWSVLDQPYLEDKPNNKNYARNGAVGAIVGIFIGSVWAVRRRPR